MTNLEADPAARAYRPDTLAVRGGLMRSSFEETAEALYLTSGFVYSNAEEAEATFKEEITRYSYSRYHNPTVSMFEERLRLLDGAEDCHATATGMAAVFAALGGLCGAGSRIVAAKALFGTCYTICNEVLPRWGVETVFVDGTDLEQWREALSVPTTVVFFETPSNPTMQLVDIAAVSELAHAAGATVVVDNVFGTPVFSRPLDHGADLVVYSATKHIDGQGRCTRRRHHGGRVHRCHPRGTGHPQNRAACPAEVRTGIPGPSTPRRPRQAPRAPTSAPGMKCA